MQLWERNADWAAVAGGDNDAVVVTGKLLTKGYEVLDPRTGPVRRTDTEAAAVWTYANAILDVRCVKARRLRAERLGSARQPPLWTVEHRRHRVRAVRRQPRPAGHPAADPRRRWTTASAGPAVAAGADRACRTTAGCTSSTPPPAGSCRPSTPEPDERVAVAGGRVLTVTGDARRRHLLLRRGRHRPAGPAARCGGSDGLNLRTAENGSACKQDRDPAGGRRRGARGGPGRAASW